MTITVRPARTDDVASIEALIEPFVRQRILLGKDPVVLYEAIQQFVVAEIDGSVVGCGALHVMWRDLGEIRTVAVAVRVCPASPRRNAVTATVAISESPMAGLATTSVSASALEVRRRATLPAVHCTR